ncbi:MFS transporter [Hydrogenovibrio kuenenii]|uniref:MFS transporter n=1 Tax=Hydrogenovibrio kuenenii TaxID=63658 RepID=UPI0004B5302B|nr:MFS transporter [Hydrogenovibrio kuenenii]
MSQNSSTSKAFHTPNFLDQPKAVWATAFAAVVGFMSIGLVDPILTSISKGLSATLTQVSLLFTSYFFVTSVMMIFTGFISSRLGGRKTLLLGAFFIIVFSALSGLSSSVAELVSFRAGWGFGNALFVVTALSVIVAASRGGTVAAILMYESALGLGISAGPLLGAFLGAHSWRYPFFGTAILMTIGFVAIWLWLPKQPIPVKKTSVLDPIRALGHAGLLTTASSAFFYNYAFFTVLAFVPFVLDMSAHSVGMIFFGWGLLLAVFSVIIAPKLQIRFSGLQILFTVLAVFSVLLLVIAFGSKTDIIVAVILSGALIGICNTVYTEMALEVSGVEKHVASAGYNFVRWFSGVIAPFSAPLIAEHFGSQWAFMVAAVSLIIAPSILFVRRKTVGRFDHKFAVNPYIPPEI